MNTAAMIFMIGSWAVITVFTSYFFIKVLRTPQEKSGSEDAPSADNRS